jgi:hypothetical protein
MAYVLIVLTQPVQNKGHAQGQTFVQQSKRAVFIPPLIRVKGHRLDQELFF